MYSMKKMSIKQFKQYSLQRDEFGLYDLRVETVHLEKNKRIICNHPVGSYFTLQGENLTIPTARAFPIHALAALLPLLPAKQRINHPMDWMETDAHVKCPDPMCGAAFVIARTGITIFRNSEVSGAVGNREKDVAEL